MPVILRVKGYKFLFYEADLDEPPHIHVGMENRVAKFWLEPVQAARTGGFSPVRLREIERIIKGNQGYLLDMWHREQGKRADG